MELALLSAYDLMNISAGSALMLQMWDYGAFRMSEMENEKKEGSEMQGNYQSIDYKIRIALVY